MLTDLNEARRYLGMSKTNALDEDIAACAVRLEAEAAPRCMHLRAPIIRTGDAYEIAGIKMQSKALARLLEGCDEAYLFAATLGAGADRLISRLAVTDMAKSLITDACAAALLEAYADEQCAALGDNLTSRFSCGYGDLSLSLQPQFVKALDCAKRIGVTVTAGGMLAPVKSITAVIGIAPSKKCESGCAECSAENCEFARR